MNELHLFAGAGGGILGGILLGHTCVCAVEIEPYCRKVLLQRQRDGILPKFPIWDDVKTFDGKPWRGKVDVVCGGFPCQDISCAGRGAGIKGKRSGLWTNFARIVGEVRPSFVFVENSPMLLTRGVGTVLGDLAFMGYDNQWGTIGACSVGADHKRNRLWIFGTNANGGNATGKLRSIQAKSHQIVKKWKAEKTFQEWFRREPQLEPVPVVEGRNAYTNAVRMCNGMANRMDRLKAIGNGQVPAVVKLAWEILSGG